MGAVHLSFDNGPHPEGTPRVLRELERRGLQASFFVLGRELATPEGMALAERIRDAGHRLGNHSYTHETPLGQDPRPDAVARELEATQALLDQVWTGERWFRPFGGGGVLGPHLLSPAALAWLERERASCVLWNSVAGDWRDPQGWVERALADVEGQELSLIVLHDVVPEAMAALPRFLDELIARGHSVSEALPEDCVPVVRGEARPQVERYLSAS